MYLLNQKTKTTKLKTPILFLLLLSSLSFLNGQTQDNYYTLDIVNFISQPYSLSLVRDADLKGSSITPLNNFGQQFFLKKRYLFSKHFRLSLGGGIGHVQTGFDYVSTPEFSSEKDIGSYGYDTWRVSDEGVIFLAVLGEIGYYFATSKQGLIGIDIGIKPTYPLNGGVGFSSRRNSITGQSKFKAQVSFNPRNLIQLSMDISPYYLYRFKNSRFGIKGGASVSYSPFSPIRGKVFLFGDTDSFEADIKGGLSFAGLSIGGVYFPK